MTSKKQNMAIKVVAAIMAFAMATFSGTLGIFAQMGTETDSLEQDCAAAGEDILDTADSESDNEDKAEVLDSDRQAADSAKGTVDSAVYDSGYAETVDSNTEEEILEEKEIQEAENTIVDSVQGEVELLDSLQTEAEYAYSAENNTDFLTGEFSPVYGEQLQGYAEKIYGTLHRRSIEDITQTPEAVFIVSSHELSDDENAFMTQEEREELLLAAKLAIHAFGFDCPEEAFWWERPSFYITENIDFGVTVRIIFKLDEFDGKDQIIRLISGTREKVEEINASASEGMFSKLFYFHNALTQAADYTPGAVESGLHSHAFSGLGLNPRGTANAAGYAKAFKALCGEAGIPCMIVNGEQDGKAHMWNYVQMDDGEWYAVDVAGDDQEEGLHTAFFLAGKSTIDPGTGKSFSERYVPSGILGDTGVTFMLPALADTGKGFQVVDTQIFDDLDTRANAYQAAGMKLEKNKITVAVQKYDMIRLSQTELHKTYWQQMNSGDGVCFPVKAFAQDVEASYFIASNSFPDTGKIEDAVPYTEEEGASVELKMTGKDHSFLSATERLYIGWLDVQKDLIGISTINLPIVENNAESCYSQGNYESFTEGGNSIQFMKNTLLIDKAKLLAFAEKTQGDVYQTHMIVPLEGAISYAWGKTPYYFDNEQQNDGSGKAKFAVTLAAYNDEEWVFEDITEIPEMYLRLTFGEGSDAVFRYYHFPGVKVQFAEFSDYSVDCFQSAGKAGLGTQIAWREDISAKQYFVSDTTSIRLQESAAFVCSGDPADYSDYHIDWNASIKDTKGQTAGMALVRTDGEKAQNGRGEIQLLVTPSKAGNLIVTVEAVFSHPRILDTVTCTLTAKCKANEHTASIILEQEAVQLVMKNSSVSYTPKKPTLSPAKGFEKDVTWSAISEEAEGKNPSCSPVNGKTVFTKPGKYILRASLQGKNGANDVTASMRVYVLDDNHAAKSVSADAKTIELFRDSPSASLPQITVKDNQNPHGKVVNPRDETLLFVYDTDKIEIDLEENKISTKHPGAAFVEKVLVYSGGKKTAFTVNAYPVDEVYKKMKFQVFLSDAATGRIYKANEKVPAGIYRYRIYPKDKSTPLELDGNVFTLLPDKRLSASIAEGLLIWNDENQTLEIKGPLSGKFSYILTGDPQKRKGSFCVATQPVAPDSVTIAVEQGKAYAIEGEEKAYLLSDKTLKLRTTLSPTYANTSIRWTVSNNKIASIKGNGSTAVLTMKKTGKVYISATSTVKGAAAADMLEIRIADPSDNILCTSGKITVNSSDATTGTVLPLNDMPFIDEEIQARIVTEIKGEVRRVNGYAAEIGRLENRYAVYLKANRVAKPGKYLLALSGALDNSGQKAELYVPIVVKTTPANAVPRLRSIKNVQLNTYSSGHRAPLTLDLLNAGSGNLTLAFADPQKDMKLEKEDGTWYLVYTGEAAADTKTSSVLQNVKLKYEIQGYNAEGEVRIPKITMKANKSDYAVTLKADKLYTMGSDPAGRDIKIKYAGKGTKQKIEGIEILPEEKPKTNALCDYAEVLDFETVRIKREVPAKVQKLTGKMRIHYEGGGVYDAPVCIIIDQKSVTPAIKGVTLFGSVPIYKSVDAALAAGAGEKEGALIMHTIAPEGQWKLGSEGEGGYKITVKGQDTSSAYFMVAGDDRLVFIDPAVSGPDGLSRYAAVKKLQLIFSFSVNGENDSFSPSKTISVSKPKTWYCAKTQ